MPLTIPDETLQDLQMDERGARVEIACRLFDAGKLPLWPAAKLAGLCRTEMESELMQRKIPIYRPTLEDLQADLAALEHLDRLERERGCCR